MSLSYVASSLADDTNLNNVFLEDVLAGLSDQPKHLPCKYFYDLRGAQLFDAICDLDEYYLTRSELLIMQNHAGEIAHCIGVDSTLIEYGSGNGTKTKLLLEHLRPPITYIPVDFSASALEDVVTTLTRRFRDIEVLPVHADFTAPFKLPQSTRSLCRHTVYFPGSTIGNLEPVGAMGLLRQIVEHCGPDGGLLIGLDLQKHPAVIELAYNDALGVTAAFNLNLLRRINRELGGDFAPNQFRHKAIYNEYAGRIEMYLISRCAQTVYVGGRRFDFKLGESICTEYSHKYTLDGFTLIAMQVGLAPVRYWTDPDELFAVVYCRVRS